MRDEMKTASLCSLLVFTTLAFAEVKLSVFDQRLVLIETERIDASRLLADSVQLRDKAGMVIHLTADSVNRAELVALLSRLTDETLVDDSLRIEPADGWHYLRPLVLSVPSGWSDQPLLTLFVRARPHTELETSGQVDKARQRLRKLVWKTQDEFRWMLERMFR